MRFLQSMGCLAPAVIVIYGVVGLLLLSQFGSHALNYLRSVGWEQVPGTVVSSEVEDVWDTSGERYAGRVVYTYEVDGVTYEGNQVDLRESVYLNNVEDAEQLVAPYPVGAAVMPYVNMSDPTRAVLDRDVPSAIWVFVGIGSTLLLLSLGLGTRHVVIRRQQQ